MVLASVKAGNTAAKYGKNSYGNSVNSSSSSSVRSSGVNTSSGGGGGSPVTIVTKYDLVTPTSGVSSLQAASQALAQTGTSDYSKSVAVAQQIQAEQKSIVQNQKDVSSDALQSKIQNKSETTQLVTPAPTTVAKLSSSQTLNSPTNNAYLNLKRDDSITNFQNKLKEVKTTTQITSNSQTNKLSGYETRIQNLQKSEEQFYNSPGMKRIEQTASLITGGAGKPLEQRGLIGKTSQEVVQGAMSLVTTPQYLVQAGKKVAATGEGLIRPETREATLQEIKRAGKETLQIYKKPSTYISAALFAAPTAAGNILMGKSGFGVENAKIVYEDIKIPTKTGQQTVYKGIAVETTKRSQPVVGSTNNKLVYGTPKLDLKNIDLTKGYLPETKTAGTIIQKNVGTIYEKSGGLEQKRIMLFKEVVSATQQQKSKFVQPKFSSGTRSLSSAATQQVISFAKKEDVLLYGSKAAEAQMRPGTSRTPGDIDLQTKFTEEVAAQKAQQLAQKLRLQGDKIVISKEQPTLIRAQTKSGAVVNAVDIHAVGQAADVLNPASSAKGAYGFKFGQKPIKIEGVKTMRLSEQGIRKGASIFTLREKGLGPEAHRIKDIPDFFKTQETLLESKTFRNTGAEKALSELKQTYPKKLFEEPGKFREEFVITNKPSKMVSPKMLLANKISSFKYDYNNFPKKDIITSQFVIKPSEPSRSAKSPNTYSPSINPSGSIKFRSPSPAKPSPSPISNPSLSISPKISRSTFYDSPSPYKPSPSPSPSPYTQRIVKEPPRIPFVFGLPGLPSFGSGKGSRRSGGGKEQIKIYTPSLIGIEFPKMKLGKARVGQVLSGIGIRPINA